MPIRIDNELPAKQRLEIENIFVMSNMRADTQNIRPLKIIILNLMPTKEVTETQLLRLLSNSPLQVDIEFCRLQHTLQRMFQRAIWTSSITPLTKSRTTDMTE